MDKKFFKKCLALSISLLLTLGVGIIIFFIFYNFSSLSKAIGQFFHILRPIIYGAILAYLLRPICNSLNIQYTKIISIINSKNKKIKLSTNKQKNLALGLSIISSFLIIFIVIFFILNLVIPQLASSLPLLYDTMIEQVNKSIAFLEENKENKIYAYILNYIQTKNITIDEEIIMAKYIKPYSTSIISTVYDSISSVVLIIKDLLIGLVISGYLLVYKTRIGKQLKMMFYALFPKKVCDVVLEELEFGDKIFNGFLVGKIVDSIIIGILAYITLVILHMPYPALLSVIIGITNIVPFFGPIIGALPCIIIVFAVNPLKTIVFIIFIIILQQVDGNIIGPKILGSATGVPSFWVLFSILVFGGLFGIMGMIIGVPLFAVIHDIIKKVTYKLLENKKEKNLIDEYNKIYHSEEK